MESLTGSLKDVQQAKLKLESQLDKTRKKRKQLESEIESANAEYNQVKDLNTKLLEIMKMTQHKVAQSQAQLDSVEENNNEKRTHIQQLMTEMNNYNKKRENEMQKFQEKINELAIQLRDAKESYADNILKQCIGENRKKGESKLMELNKYENELSILSGYLEKLEQDQNSKKIANVEEDFNKDQILSLFSGEYQAAIKCLAKVDAEIRIAHGQHTSLPA